MRKLEKQFMDSLQSGTLNPILEEVKSKPKISLEIRENYIVLFYRGRSLLEIHSSGNGYSVRIEYRDELKDISIPNQEILSKHDSDSWVNFLLTLMKHVDKANPNNESEARQKLLENNYLSTLFSELTICDIECEMLDGNKIDMAGIQKHYHPRYPLLTFVEIKYGEDTIDHNETGLEAHLEDIYSLIENQEEFDEFKNRIKMIFDQKKELGLISFNAELDDFSGDCPRVILVLLNLFKNEKCNEILKKLNSKYPMKNVHVVILDYDASGNGNACFSMKINMSLNFFFWSQEIG